MIFQHSKPQQPELSLNVPQFNTRAKLKKNNSNF